MCFSCSLSHVLQAKLTPILTKNHQNSLKSLFSRRSSAEGSPNAAMSPKPIPHLSPFANSVVARCSQVLRVPTEELQNHFDTELPESVKQTSVYARNFLEFCSYQALNLLTRRPDYLSDKEFRRLTFDMMLAWEDPSNESEPVHKETASCSNQEIEDADGWSLFYLNSTNMAVQVDENKTVRPEAFARIAPVCAAVADIITVHNLFNALTSSSGGRLHFPIYDKYLRSLHKVIKAAKSALGPPSIANLQLTEGEIILDVDGTVPTQPVLQHMGISAWPGRLTLTNYALYFESLGVGTYDKAVRYDLALDMKQVIKAEMTGPLGARLFDKAVMYKSKTVIEPVYFEFPEFKGSSRRDYWLDVCLEIFRAHRFIWKHNLKETQRSEALARAMLGIFRYHAVREAFRISSSQYKTLLAFNLAESLPGGDVILETLSSRLALVNASGTKHDDAGTAYSARQQELSPVSLLTLFRLGFNLQKEVNIDEGMFLIGDTFVGETNPLEAAVKQSMWDTGKAEAAQATVDQVKVDGIDTNTAVMKELLFPVIEAANRLQVLASWEESFKSTLFMVLTSYTIHRSFLPYGVSVRTTLYALIHGQYLRTCKLRRHSWHYFCDMDTATHYNYGNQEYYTDAGASMGWIRYILPSLFIFLAVLILWRKHFNRGKPLEAFKVTLPPNRNAVEQLLTLQDAITQVEALIQAGNIILLKIRALLFDALPQATNRVALMLVFMAVVLAFLPFRYLILLAFLEPFTREMPLRKASSDRWLRRVREWWIRIPAAPVQLVKLDDKKRK